MKNLKKLLAVIIAVTVLATSIIPAFAAGSYNYSAQAQALYDLGLYKGSNPNTFEPDLGSPLDRQQGVVMLVRLLGKEAAALALSNSEVDSTLIIFSDANKIASWAKKYVAYAVLYKYVAGLPNGTFAPNDPLLGKQFGTMLLNALGYTVDAASYAAACYQLSNIGAITFAEAAKFNDKELIRDDMVGIAYGILAVNYKATGKSVIETMVEQKIVTEAAAIAAGVYNHKLEKDARAAIEEYKKGSLNTLEEIAAVEKKKADADAKVAKIVDEATKKALQKEIDVRTNEIAEAKAAINAATEAENKAIADAEAAVKAYEGALSASVSDVAKAKEEVTKAADLEKTAREKVAAVKTESTKKSLLDRIEAQVKKVQARASDIAVIEEATAAVDNYLAMAYDSLENIAKAEELGKVASDKVAKISDSTAKSALSKKIEERSKAVADAKAKLSVATVTVTADNFKTVKLTFSKAMDFNSLQSAIKLDDGSRAFDLKKLSDDNKAFLLIYDTALTNQSTSIKLTINGARDLNGVTLDNYSTTYVVRDIKDPEITKVEVINPKTIRIYTTEPLQVKTKDTVIFDGNTAPGSSSFGATITIDNVYVLAKVTEDLVKGYIQFNLTSPLNAGTRSMVIKDLRDYAGFAINTTLSFQVADDKEPPVATAVEIAGKDKVKVTFNEDIADGKTPYGSPKFSIRLAGNTTDTPSENVDYNNNVAIITFPKNTLNLLATLGYEIRYQDVADALGNLLSEVKVISGVAENDPVKPVVASVTVENDNSITVVFSKKVEASESSFRLLKSSDKTIINSNAQTCVKYDDGKTFKITFDEISKGVNAGNYILEIRNVYDTSINRNPVDITQKTITVVDTKMPQIDAIIITKASNPYTIEIYFTEVMDASYVANKNNYFISYKSGSDVGSDVVSVPLSSIQNATLTTSDYKKIIITLPKNGNVNGYPIDGISVLARDKQGNPLTNNGAIGAPFAASNFLDPTSGSVSGTYAFDKNDFDANNTKFTATNKIQLKVKSDAKNVFSLTTPIPVDAFKLTSKTGVDVGIGVIGATLSADGRTLELTLNGHVAPNARYFNATTSAYEEFCLTVDKTKGVKDQFGFSLDLEKFVIKDGIKPEMLALRKDDKQITIIGDEYDSITELALNNMAEGSYVKLRFTEEVKSSTGVPTDIAQALEVKIGSKTLTPGIDYYTVFNYTVFSLKDGAANPASDRGTEIYVVFKEGGRKAAKNVLKKDLSNLTVTIKNKAYIVDIYQNNAVK